MAELPNKLHKDTECVYCEHIFDCKGKPEIGKPCLNFQERKKEDKNKHGNI